MSNFTHISFSQIGSKINLLYNGAAVVLNTKYASGGTFSIEKKNINDVGSPFETIKYKAYKNDLESNEAVIQINLLGIPGAPLSANITIEIENNSTVNLIDHIPLNSSADRIIIEDFNQEIGELKKNDELLYPGSTVMKYDFPLLKFYSSGGIGTPYQEIKYKAANSSMVSVSQYTLTMNITGVASYILDDYTVEIVNDAVERNMTSTVINAKPNKPVQLKVTIDLDEIAAWPPEENNEIILSSNLFSKRYTGNVTDDIIDLTADENGQIILSGDMNFIQDNTGDIPGNLIIELISVDGDAVLVSPTENTININFAV